MNNDYATRRYYTNSLYGLIEQALQRGEEHLLPKELIPLVPSARAKLVARQEKLAAEANCRCVSCDYIDPAGPGKCPSCGGVVVVMPR